MIDSPSEAAVFGIVERSQEIEWNHERKMLQRLDGLVRRFPDSCHRDKVRITTHKAGLNNQYYEILDSRPMKEQPIITRRIEPDPEFDAGTNIVQSIPTYRCRPTVRLPTRSRAVDARSFRQILNYS